MSGRVFVAILVLLLALFAWIGYRVTTTPQVSFTCETSGAAIHHSTHDNNLHVVVWCTKGGRVVP